MEELSQKIKILEDKISKLENGLSYSQSESIKDLIFLPNLGTYGTETTTVPVGGGDVTCPAQPSGTIPVEYKGTIYRLLYK